MKTQLSYNENKGSKDSSAKAGEKELRVTYFRFVYAKRRGFLYISY